ncbi:MAG: M28 family peptidase [Bacteroidales bacterium]|nr:M28 family peptidase [Bacteroidales bacterium]
MFTDSLKKYTYTLASDEFAGRLANTTSGIKVSNYISKYFKQNGLAPIQQKSYFQKFPPLYRSTYRPETFDLNAWGFLPKKSNSDFKTQNNSGSHPKKNNSDFKTQNVIGIVWGSDPNLDHIVVSSHHDHLGRKGNQIFHGADDNGSGTAALIEMSRIVKIASNQGYKPKRTVVFM